MNTHANADLLARYVAGDPGLDDATLWSLETHLESCRACRARLGTTMDGGTVALLDRVHRELGQRIAAGPAPYRRRRWWSFGRRWTVAWSVLPWLAVTVGMLATALLFDRAYPQYPSMVLLVAPVAPLFSVAAAWSRRADPAWELLTATPRAGLWLLLRRTLAVLAVLIPLLMLAGWRAGQSPARWLLPCLVFTAATLALGGRIGVQRAAYVLTAAWAAGVMVPTVAEREPSALLQPGSQPGWALALAVVGAIALLRRADYRRLTSRN
ncbi:zf-HC2 domain-containing protein [Planosporangium thailandense]|uniref:Zf-HC2 domain-containing protein n=1 Tax=Planosporangium thailandense TaxID=765197 RepID=A0ABX0XZV3_9ACTN|nr:zf-HC2 domain-containing protein [Planosporangium thailandense]NJC70684.1 zf-HC2 domain-containing protein [Planosporangium thailandense]